jgi:hypothetical protein
LERKSSRYLEVPGSEELVIAGAKLLFWNPSKSFFDVLPTTGPGYFSAG